jgi:hypothetical protein
VSARHRQHTKKLRAAQHVLADREIDLASYDRVIADMKSRGLSPFAIAVVDKCRDATRHDCDELREVVANLERKIVA